MEITEDDIMIQDTISGKEILGIDFGKKQEDFDRLKKEILQALQIKKELDSINIKKILQELEVHISWLKTRDIDAHLEGVIKALEKLQGIQELMKK
jgi:hypothetical protein